MARLVTVGFETNDAGSGRTENVLLALGTVAATVSTTQPRTGLRSAKCDSGAGNGTSVIGVSGSLPATNTYFLRTYFYFANLPGSTVVIGSTSSAIAGVGVKLTAAGKLQLFNLTAGTQIGSDSVDTLTTGQWYRIEFKAVASFPTTACELVLDGTTVATSGAISVNGSSTMTWGWFQAPGANAVLYLDDLAANDNTGAAQTTYPGDGKVVLLLPTADSARGTGWVGGAGGTTSLFAAVDNTPPVGVADTGTDTSQIRNATAAANSNMDFTMTTYSAAGIAAADTVNVIDPIIATAAPVTTSSKQGTVGVASNPTIANIALAAGGTAGAFWSGSAGATYVSGWKISHGTITYAPSVTVGTAPVMRVTQVTSSTRIAMVCFMGMNVDYTPAAVVDQVPYFNTMPQILAQ